MDGVRLGGQAKSFANVKENYQERADSVVE